MELKGKYNPKPAKNLLFLLKQKILTVYFWAVIKTAKYLNGSFPGNNFMENLQKFPGIFYR